MVRKLWMVQFFFCEYILHTEKNMNIFSIASSLSILFLDPLNKFIKCIIFLHLSKSTRMTIIVFCLRPFILFSGLFIQKPYRSGACFLLFL
jgi:hypothetical protein